MLSLVVPTLNEGPNIEPFVEALGPVLERLGTDECEVVVADGGSTDDTVARVQALGRQRPWLRAIAVRTHRGLAGSVLEGFASARGDLLAVMDADLQHPPEALAPMIEAIDAGFDLVVGSRYAHEGTAGGLRGFRRAGSMAATKMARLALGPRVASCEDPLSGLFMVRRGQFHPERLRVSGFKLLFEILATHPHLRLREVPIEFGPRRGGRSKLGTHVTLRFFLQTVRISVQTGVLPALLVGGGLLGLILWGLTTQGPGPSTPPP